MSRSSIVLGVLACGLLGWLLAGEARDVVAEEYEIESRVIETDANEVVLAQTAVYNAPVSKVWDAYTTAEGYSAWAAPTAEIDLKTGGTILFHYGRGAKVGDPGTQKLHIRAVVPQELLTLQAEIAANWPEVLKKDADRLHNVIVFESLPEDRTRIRSYGVGYGKTDELMSMMKFFKAGNERLLKLLGKYVEEGVRSYERPGEKKAPKGE